MKKFVVLASTVLLSGLLMSWDLPSDNHYSLVNTSSIVPDTLSNTIQDEDTIVLYNVYQITYREKNFFHTKNKEKYEYYTQIITCSSIYDVRSYLGEKQIKKIDHIDTLRTNVPEGEIY